MTNRRRKYLQRLKNNLIFHIARGAVAAARVIPLATGLKIGAAIGAAAWRLAGHERRLTLLHLKVAFPEWTEAERLAVGRESFRNLGRSFFEMFHFEDIFATLDSPHPYVTFSGKEHLDAARAQGRGGVFITGHLGNWELMAATFVRCGYPGYEIVRKLYDERLDQMLNDHRRRHGYIPLTRGGQELVADIIALISRQEFLGILIDQDTKVRGVFADWFGHPAWTPSGAAYICYQLGTDAFLLTNHRRPEGGHAVAVSAPIPRPQTGDAKADIQAYTQMLNDHLTAHIRQYPAEWVWMHRRWKTRPPGEPPEAHPAPLPPKPARLWRAVAKIAGRLLRPLSWETADRAGATLGRTLYWFMPRRRRAGRPSFAAFGRALVDYLRHPLMDAGFFRDRVIVEGLDALEAAHRRGRGVLLVADRFGGLEVALWKLATLGFPLHLAARRLNNRFLNDRLVWLRRAHGVESIPEKDAAAAANRALARGRIVATVAAEGPEVENEMFGQALETAGLAAECGCPVVAVRARREGPGRFRVRLEEMPEPRPTTP